jgi:hypothetical protein
MHEKCVEFADGRLPKIKKKQASRSWERPPEPDSKSI